MARKDFEKSQILGLLKQGLNQKEVARRLNISPETVYKFLKSLDLLRPPRPKVILPPDDVIRKLYEAESLSSGDIGRKFGVKPSLIYKRLVKIGVPIRSPFRRIDRSTLHELYVEKRFSVKKVARLLKTTRLLVLRELELNGLPIRGRPRVEVDHNELKRLYLEHSVGAETLAKRLKIPVTRLRREMKLMGLQKRDQRHYRHLPRRRCGPKRAPMRARWEHTAKLFLEDKLSVKEIAEKQRILVVTVQIRLKRLGIDHTKRQK